MEEIDKVMEQTNKIELAGCVIENDEGRILLLHRNTPERQQWETPGGKLEPGENPLEAARREVGEELGVEVDILGEIGKKDFSEDNHKMGYVWYNGKITSGEPAPIEDKHDKIGFFSWDELRDMKDLSPNTKNLVDFHFASQSID